MSCAPASLEAMRGRIAFDGAGAYWNVISIPSVKLEVVVGFLSRCQHCQFQVLPESTAVGPEGVGTEVRFRLIENSPPESMDPIWLTCRPIPPPRQRLPWLPPGLVTKPWVWLFRK